MRTLALDLGTHTGYAYDTLAGMQCGTKLLATAKELKAAKALRLDRRCDIRVTAFWEWLTALQSAHRFELIVFEDVQFSSSTMQTQLWSSFRAVVWLAFPGVTIEAVPVGTLKKFATGSGSADKETMAKFFLLDPQNANFPKLDDNGIDAVWLYRWAQKNLSRMKTP